MRSGVHQRERRPPRSAHHHPLFNTKVGPNQLNIGDQSLAVVIDKFTLRLRLACAALIKQNYTLSTQVEPLKHGR